LRPSRFIAIYEDQPKGESIHSQEMCLPGSGWEFKNAGKAVVQLTAPPGSTVQRFGSHRRCRVNGSTPTITVNRAVMEKGAYKQLSYFWTPAARPGADERLGAEALRFDGDVGNVKSVGSVRIVFLKCGGPNRVLLRQAAVNRLSGLV